MSIANDLSGVDTRFGAIGQAERRERKLPDRSCLFCDKRIPTITKRIIHEVTDHPAKLNAIAVVEAENALAQYETDLAAVKVVRAYMGTPFLPVEVVVVLERHLYFKEGLLLPEDKWREAYRVSLDNAKAQMDKTVAASVTP